MSQSLEGLKPGNPVRATPVRYGGRGRRINAPALAFAAFWTLLTAFAAPLKAEPVTLLGFGDSLMAGYGLPEGETFPARLEAALKARGHDVRVVNAGVSGDTTAGGAARIAWSLAEMPDAVIVELGGNDGLRGIPTPETRRNLEAILEALAAKEIPVLFAGMRAPPNMGREYGEGFQGVFDDLAVAYDVLYYPFFLDGVAAEPALNQADGIHPNVNGVDVIVGRILPLVEKLVAQARRR